MQLLSRKAASQLALAGAVVFLNGQPHGLKPKTSKLIFQKSLAASDR
jgi:hypothetical protein